ncbi:Hypothetical protein I595_256 [Croceitalea dokdonensis DOKDO 023]|uniref:DUF1853 family protein n=1 Tax=Croceitalea dokdonensis DOKDO 023 TaxID=1300341 RepID=A0A0P7A947_9FLAO|nr:DUF1853 family protein [Croceitalea dokdonensis]KPM33353.1 Hypothetical protein I595_256 [Croceitalea dokdonensis DOKDO 023]
MEKELCQGFYQTHPLWTKEQFGISQFNFPEVHLGNFLPYPIPEKLRLGHQMEYVFEQLLQYSQTWEVLSKNILVDHGKTRLGELDFILKNRRTQAVHHVELTYKFYIVNPNITEPIHRLMGPNRRDMFFSKLDKLRDKQFPLLFSAPVDKMLRQLGISAASVHQNACFKAQLFTPYGEVTPKIRPLNTNCFVGNWLPFDAFKKKEFADAQYYIPFKREWVISPVPNRTYLSHFETLMEINLRMIRENAPMLWMKKPDGSLRKIFVVWW